MASSSLEPALRVPYKTVEKVDIPTDIYLPVARSAKLAKACPVLIMIHGGAFMLGHAGINNKDQIQDCLERGWIVLAIEYRLCPGVNILEGPMTDVRDALQWAQKGGLASVLQENNLKVIPDEKRVMVMGTSSGGHLALSTAFHTPQPPLAILDFYGAKNFHDPFWTQPLSSMPLHFSSPRPLSEISSLNKEKTIFIGGLSLEGTQTQSPPSAPDPKIRQAYAMHMLATGKVLDALWPTHPREMEKFDPIMNVSSTWPPIAIVHGTADTMIPMRLSKEFERVLKEKGVETKFIEVEGEQHTFCGAMEKGGRTWEMQREGFEFLECVVRRSYGKK